MIATRAYRAATAMAMAILVLASAGAQAQGAKQEDAPTLIDSDTLEYDDAKQTSVFTGNVVLTRGALTLRADRLELRQAANGAQYATATAQGKEQVFVRQTQPDSVEVVEGTGDRVEYDSSKEEIQLVGHAVIQRLACGKVLDEIRGERVRYNQQTDVYSASGGPQAGTSNRRVRTMIQSRDKSDNIVASCAPAAGGKN
jgi:lipopolysaccharide export system protein LptA